MASEAEIEAAAEALRVRGVWRPHDVAAVVLSAAERVRGDREFSLEWGVRTVLETFEKDVAQGYKTRDKTFAISILRKAIEQSAASPVRGQGETERLRPGLEDALAVIDGMGRDWPSAVAHPMNMIRNLGEEYQREFAYRIRERIAALTASPSQSE